MKIFTVFKTHFDIGFTELSSEVVRRYGTTMLEDVLKTCEGTQKFGERLCYKWTMASWPLLKTLEGASPENRARAEALIERGQLLWHALPFTTHTECCGVEDFVRGFDFARELCAHYGKPFPISAKMTDVPGHTRFLVAALAGAGVRFLHLGCNPASTPPKVPLLFWWEHSDGSRVLTFYNSTYGSSVLPPKDWPYPVWLNMNQTNDNIGPQGPEVIEELLRETEAAGCELTVGSMDDFFLALLPHLGEEVPVVRAELSDTWIHGVGSYPAEVGELRRWRERLRAAEKRCARAKVWDGELEALSREADEAALLFCEHTWGMDVKTHLGSPRHYEKPAFLAEREEPRAKKLEASWREQRERAALVREKTDRMEKILEGKGLPFSVRRQPEGKEFTLKADKAGRIRISREGRHLLTLGSARYTVGGLEDLTRFERAYLRRLPVWAIYDFGRMDYPECETEVFEPLSAEVEKMPDGLRVIHRYYRRAAEAFGWTEQTVTTVQDLGGRLRVVWEAEVCATPYVESASLRMTPASPGILLNKTGSLIRPEEIAENANHVVNCLERFVDCNEGTLAVLTRDAPLLSQGEELLFRFREKGRAPGKTLFFNLFNNMWGTNFPQWIEGSIRAEFEIVPHERGDLSALYDPDDAGLDLSGAVLESVRMLGPEEALCRIREINGRETEADFSAGGARWEETDWFGENGRPLPVKEGRVRLTLRPCEIKTVRRR